MKTEKILADIDQRGEQMYEQLSLDCFISVSIRNQRNIIFNILSLSQNVQSATFYPFNFLSSQDGLRSVKSTLLTNSRDILGVAVDLLVTEIVVLVVDDDLPPHHLPAAAPPAPQK